jgi:cytochrome c2
VSARTVLALGAALLLVQGCAESPGVKPAVTGDAARGRIALAQYACHSCHMIPGVTGPRVYVGRPLEGLAERKYIAGQMPNTQENLVRWIRDPKQVDPQTVMPALGVTEADARDMSGYLLTR